MRNSLFTYCDNWWVEKNRAYFCARRMGVVLGIDLDEQRCELITRFPQCKTPAHLTNSFCVKQGDFIFCIPYKGEDIGYYDLKRDVWDTIETGCEKRMIVCADQAFDGRIWLAEYYGKKVYQINLYDKVLEKQYSIPADSGDIDGECVYTDTFLYCVAGNSVYCIDTKTSKIVRYQILNTGDNLSTICYDGRNFWLSGNRKEIYIWNPCQGMIKVIDGLEIYGNLNLAENVIKKNFPIFLHSVVMGEHIWYIPLQANMPIIYINRKNYEMNTLKIEEEEENEKSLIDRQSGFKYIFLYSRQDRYIGLFSHKNQVVLELDTIGFCVEKKEFNFSKESVRALLKGYYDDVMLWEGKPSDNLAYSMMIKYNVGSDVSQANRSGYRIYHGI